MFKTRKIIRVRRRTKKRLKTKIRARKSRRMRTRIFEIIRLK